MINEYTYGCFKADGKEFLGDIMIKNNKVHYWQDLTGWDLNVKHINNLLMERPDVFVIGTGAGGLLRVGDDIKEHLQSWKMNSTNRPVYHIVKNTEAIKIINSSMENGKRVCAVLAGSC
ncbi:MAG: MTH938/NDUFAF3 family protein [Nanoarchaeota archaeon]|nr:MTH938/NDUFAF3 family protein [Nanoarchaeota archaeon]